MISERMIIGIFVAQGNNQAKQVWNSSLQSKQKTLEENDHNATCEFIAWDKNCRGQVLFGLLWEKTISVHILMMIFILNDAVYECLILELVLNIRFKPQTELNWQW